MNVEVLTMYVCAKCGGKLTVQDGAANSTDDEIIEGGLVCTDCTKTYIVKNGIPRFVPAENYAGSFGYQWNIHRETQLDSYTGRTISRDRLFGVSGWPERMTDQTILEAGSGSGRFTEVLTSTGATIYSFDLSSAVDANWKNNGRRKNLNLFQGNIYSLPLRKRSFDKVMCLGVIQHTPDPERTFRSLTEYVRPGGDLVIDIYGKSFVSLLHWRFLFRPVTKRMNKELLYKLISVGVPVLLPLAILLRKVAGRLGARLMPISEYSNLGLPYELNKQWAILDTFDMYSPAHDHPQTMHTVKRWFEEAGFIDIFVGRGPNGIIARGKRPA